MESSLQPVSELRLSLALPFSGGSCPGRRPVRWLGQFGRTFALTVTIGWALAWAGLANAQTTYTWTRGGDAAAWNNSLNWSPGGIPEAGDTAIVNVNTGTTADGPNMALNGNRAAAQLVFTGPAEKWVWGNAPGSTNTNNRELTLTTGVLADATSGPAWVGFANQVSWRNLVIRLSGSPSIVNDSASSLSFGNPANFVSGTYRPGSSIQSVVGTASTVTFSGTGTGDIAVNGRISNGGSGASVTAIVDRPNGRVVYNDENAYSGGTAIQTGTLALGLTGGIDHNALISVAAGGVFDLSAKTSGVTFTTNQQLGGSGTVVLPTAATLTGPGNLIPGLAGTVGTLTFSGDGTLSLANTAAGGLRFDLGMASDLVSLPSGVLDLAAGGVSFDSFAFTPGDGFGEGSYTLFSAASIIGELGSPLTGDIGGLSATLSVQGSNLVLTAVPEPSTWVLTVLGASALLAIGRGRVRRGGRSTATPTQRLDG
jgi:hypothetical protein